MRKTTFFSYKRLTFIIILSSLVISVSVGYFASFLLKKAAIEEMAKVDAKKSSLLVFEALYSAMEKGFSREDLERIVKRLNSTEHEMNVTVHRGEKTAKLFGYRDKYPNDEAIQKALNGEDMLIVMEDSIRYLYPVKAREECLKCHVNANVGDVNGVIDVNYPITSLKLSLNSALNYFFVLLIFCFTLTYLFFYLGLNRFIIAPLLRFIAEIKGAIKRNETDKKLRISSRVYELRNLEKSFNKMLIFLANSRRKELEQIYKDQLTNLPNRLRLLEDLKNYKTPFLAVFNIDAFKEINDFYGVAIGDFLLAKIGEKLKNESILGERVYRIAGDEYAILLEAPQTPVDARRYIEGFINGVNKEIFRHGEYEIGAHITAGVAIGGLNVMENADMALKQARKESKHLAFFDPSLQISKQYEHNIKWTKILKNALEESMIRPYFQPIMNVKSEKIEKYEALARLIDKSGSPVAPYSFLAVAKKSKLYPLLTKTIIEKSFATFEGSEHSFSINISAEDIENEDTRELIYAALFAFKEPSRVVFEITESEGIENFEGVSSFIEKIKSIGSKVAIDDFGSGYSNFAYVMRLNVDFIKIDASIIKNIAIDKNSYIITKTIVDFCNKMGIKTIAEYVNTKEIFDVLKELDVDFAQGYYVGEPQKEIPIR